MSTFESDKYRWRETYFVLFDAARRPTLAQVHETLAGLSDHFELTNPTDSEEGGFESLTILAPDDYAALDISYIEGDEVTEQVEQLADDMKHASLQAMDLEKLKRLPGCDARFDVMHFEQLLDTEDDGDEILDPSALLLVMEALVDLTQGVGIDPQSGALM